MIMEKKEYKDQNDQKTGRVLYRSRSNEFYSCHLTLEFYGIYHLKGDTLGIQSPKLRMVSWNLNTFLFGGDCTPLAHPMTR